MNISDILDVPDIFLYIAEYFTTVELCMMRLTSKYFYNSFSDKFLLYHAREIYRNSAITDYKAIPILTETSFVTYCYEVYKMNNGNVVFIDHMEIIYQHI